VALAFGIGKAELSEPPRKMLPRVIGDDEDRRSAVFIIHCERRRFVGSQKTVLRFIHLRSLLLRNGSVEKRIVIGVAIFASGPKNACYPEGESRGGRDDSYRQAHHDLSVQAAGLLR
jgi:hypothetical protein